MLHGELLKLLHLISCKVLDGLRRPLTKRLRPLVFYSGTTPVTSIVQSIIHITVLHFGAVMPFTFTIFIIVLQLVGWLATAAIWTICESASSPTPGLCPQHIMFDNGKFGLMGLSIFKDVLAWVLVLCYAAMLALTVKAAQKYRDDPWRRRDELLELAEYDKQRGLT